MILRFRKMPRRHASVACPLIVPILVCFLALLVVWAPSVSGFSKPSSSPAWEPAAARNGRKRSSQAQLVLFGESSKSYFVPGPSQDTKPDYENIHGPMGKDIDNVFMTMFREKLAEQVGVDSDKPKTDYEGIMDLVKAMNSRFSDRTEIQKRSQKTLSELFPSWMPPSYAVLFSKPFPAFSARMNAWATKMAGTWLMGECEINDVEIDNKGTIGPNQGLLVKRCRFLEESQCASYCVNSCKIPTQNFFIQEMGLPLTMTPDYETFECQFAFGKVPDEESEVNAKNTPCLSRCPSAGGLREWHNRKATSGSIGVDQELAHKDLRQCQLMD